MAKKMLSSSAAAALCGPTNPRPALPPGWRLSRATVGEADLKLGPDGAADLSGRTGTFTVRFAVEKER